MDESFVLLVERGVRSLEHIISPLWPLLELKLEDIDGERPATSPRLPLPKQRLLLEKPEFFLDNPIKVRVASVGGAFIVNKSTSSASDGCSFGLCEFLAWAKVEEKLIPESRLVFGKTGDLGPLANVGDRGEFIPEHEDTTELLLPIL